MLLKSDKAGEITILQIEGDTLDASNATEFKNEINAILEQSQVKVLLDMQNLKFVDSSGLGAIISCLRKLKSVGGDLKLCQMSASVRALFELVRLHRIFDIFDSRDEGIARFKSA